MNLTWASLVPLLLLLVAPVAITAYSQETVISGEDSYILEPLIVSMNGLVPDTTYTLMFNVSGFILLASSGGVEVVEAQPFGNLFAFKPSSTSADLVFLPFASGSVSIRLLEGPFTRGFDVFRVRPLKIDPLFFPEAVANESVDLEVILASMTGLNETRPGGYSIHYRIRDFGDGYLTIYVTGNVKLGLDKAFAGGMLDSISSVYDDFRLTLKGALRGEPGSKPRLELIIRDNIDGIVSGLVNMGFKLLDLEFLASGSGSISLFSLNTPISFEASNVDFNVEEGAFNIYSGGIIDVMIEDSSGILALTLSGKPRLTIDSPNLDLSLNLTGSTDAGVELFRLNSLILEVNGDAVLEGGSIEVSDRIIIKLGKDSSLSMSTKRGDTIMTDKLNASGEGSYALKGYKVDSRLVNIVTSRFSPVSLIISADEVMIESEELKATRTSITAETLKITASILTVRDSNILSSYAIIASRSAGEVESTVIKTRHLDLLGPGNLLFKSSTINTTIIRTHGAKVSISSSTLELPSITTSSSSITLEEVRIESPVLKIQGEASKLSLIDAITTSEATSITGGLEVNGSIGLEAEKAFILLDGIHGSLTIKGSPKLAWLSIFGSLNFTFNITECKPTAIHITGASVDSLTIASGKGLCTLYIDSQLTIGSLKTRSPTTNMVIEGIGVEVSASETIIEASGIDISGLSLSSKKLSINAGSLNIDDAAIEADNMKVTVASSKIEDTIIDTGTLDYTVSRGAYIKDSRIRGDVVNITARSLTLANSALSSAKLIISNGGIVSAYNAVINVSMLSVDNGATFAIESSNMTVSRILLRGHSALTLATTVINAPMGSLRVEGYGPSTFSITYMDVSGSELSRLTIVGSVIMKVNSPIPSGFSFNIYNATGELLLEPLGELHLNITGGIDARITPRVNGGMIALTGGRGIENVTITLQPGIDAYLTSNSASYGRLTLILNPESSMVMEGVFDASVIEAYIGNGALLKANKLVLGCDELTTSAATTSRLVLVNASLDCERVLVQADSIDVEYSTLRNSNLTLTYTAMYIAGSRVVTVEARLAGIMGGTAVIEETQLVSSSLKLEGDGSLVYSKGSTIGSSGATLRLGDVGLVLDKSVLEASLIGSAGGARLLVYNGSMVKAGDRLSVTGLELVVLNSTVDVSSLELVDSRLIVKYSLFNASVEAIGSQFIQALGSAGLDMLEGASVRGGLFEVGLDGVTVRVDYIVDGEDVLVVGYAARSGIGALSVNPPVNDGILVDVTIASFRSTITGVNLDLDLNALGICKGDYIEVYELDYTSNDWIRIGTSSIITDCKASTTITLIGEKLYTATLILNPTAIEPETITKTETVIEERTVTETTTKTIKETITKETTITQTTTTTETLPGETKTITIAGETKTETVYRTTTLPRETTETKGISTTLMILTAITSFILGVLAAIIAGKPKRSQT